MTTAECLGPSRPGPWGPWATLALGAAIALIYLTAQSIAMTPLAVFHAARGAGAADLRSLAMSGMNVAIAVTLSCPVMLTACGLASLLRQGPPLGDYLAIRLLPRRRVLFWSVLMVGVGLVESFLDDWLDRPIPRFMLEAYTTGGHLPFFWSAVILWAPLAEEVFFRGFLFSGLAASRIGTPGAIAVTTILFALMHVGQYEVYELTQVAVAGLCFGLARARTGSLLPPLAMHVCLNFASMILFLTTEVTG